MTGKICDSKRCVHNKSETIFRVAQNACDYLLDHLPCSHHKRRNAARGTGLIFVACLCCYFPPSAMEGVTTIAALYLLCKSHKRRKVRRPRLWAHDIIRRRTQLGEFHRLLQELRLDDRRFQCYLRLTISQFDDLLARIGARNAQLDTNYRRSISATERLSICLRLVSVSLNICMLCLQQYSK